MFRSLAPDELLRHEKALAEDGFTVVPELMTIHTVEHMLDCLRALHATTPFGDNDFTGFRTKRVFNLFAKTRVLDPLLVNADALQLVRSLLGPEAQLSIASTMEIFPGETPQALHQDDAYFPVTPHPPLVVNTMWALTAFTEANGGTRVAPGSNRRTGPVDVRAPTIAVEMPAGSLFLWDGQVWHGGGANVSNEARFGLSLNYCRGWIRQQENQYLGLAPELVRSLPEDVQRLLGFDICQFVGWVDGRHPLRAIIPEVRERIWSGQPSKRR